jgi:glycosyltransferase involved in cell wall biosynthesis
VVVPSYRRPHQLRQCLEGLCRQTLAPEQIIVVLRAGDAESDAVVSELGIAPLRRVTVDQPGVVAAMAAGLAHTTAPMVALTDDDAVPRVDWLERLAVHLADERLGAAGGRDVIAGCTDPPTADVGRVRWWGGHVGNHHRGAGPAREVAVLKGVNVAFRAAALALPAPGVLRGRGAEAHWEILVCDHLRRQGLKLLYDPAVMVDHRRGRRFDDDDRSTPSSAAVSDSAHNQLMGTAGLAPVLRPVHYLGGVLRGDRALPGIGRALVALACREPAVARRLVPTLRGRTAAYRRLGWRGRPEMVAVRKAGVAA